LTREQNKHGDFVWYELGTTDAAAAQEFYGGLVGWSFSSGPNVEGYWLFAADGPNVGGLLALTPAMIDDGAVPMWTGYITVDDVDASAAAVTKAGGKILMQPWDIDDVGRIALVTDPQGALFYISKPLINDKSESFVGETPTIGHCGWNDLCTSDPQAAKSFYGDLFGWELADSMDMGPAGTYEMYRNGADGERLLGGIMPKPEEMPMSLWSFYFRVASIDTAVTYVQDNGGSVMMDPMEVPGGEWVFAGVDPQGAMFSVLGPR